MSSPLRTSGKLAAEFEPRQPPLFRDLTRSLRSSRDDSKLGERPHVPVFQVNGAIPADGMSLGVAY